MRSLLRDLGRPATLADIEALPPGFKGEIIARIGVAWLWYVDADARTVTVSRLEGGSWVEVAVCADDDVVRLEPFPAVELRLSEWWSVGTTG